MQERLAHSLSSEGLIKKNDRILVAVSGGVDSVCLLRLLHQLGYSITAAHCNFQLRDKESDDDARFVEQLCTELNIPCHVHRFHTRQFAKTSGLSIQEAARKLRYTWFEELRQKTNCDYIATAHHNTDHLETVLINQIRGTGIQGFLGIQHRLEDHIIRPLLAFESYEIRSYAKTNNWAYREDSSNAKDDYLRNRIRHHVLPALLDIDDQIGQKIAQNSIKVKEHLELHNTLIAKELQKFSFSKNGLHYIQIEGLLSYPQPHLMLYRILHRWGFNYDRCKQVSQTSAVGAIVKSGTHSIVRDRDYWIVSRLTAEPDQIEITTSGDYTFASYLLSIREVAEGQVIERNKSTIYINPNLTGKLTARSWQEGDRIQPFGMSGTKLVSDVLSDNKIPNTHKQDIPIVVDQKNQIIWVAGLCFSEKHRVSLDNDQLEHAAWQISLRQA